MNYDVVQEKEATNRNGAATNIMLLDTTTLISILVMVVFIIKLFNNVLKTNSVGTLPTAGRRHRQKRSANIQFHNYNRNKFNRRIFVPQPHRNRQTPSTGVQQSRPQFALATANLEAQRFNRAVLTYDFIYLLIAIAATLLFVFETLYRVFNVFNSSSSGRSRKTRQITAFEKDDHDCDDDEKYEECQRVLNSIHFLSHLYE